MAPRDWENIYREKGDLGFKVLPIISKASAIFKKKGYQKILDLGCGTGRHGIFLAKKGFRVYATDMSPTGLEIAVKKAAALNLCDIHFRQHDMKTIPFPGGFFDAVVCIWTLHHGTLEQIQRTITEIYRVLKSGGMVVTDLLSTTTESYGIGREIGENTFIGEKRTEEDVPHHYSTKEEIQQLFTAFGQPTIRLSTRHYVDHKTGQRHFSRRYYIEAIK